MQAANVYAISPALPLSFSGRPVSGVAQHGGSKVPQLFVLFWIIKIVATTLGETGGDAVSMSLGLGYWLSSLVFLVFLLGLLALQLRARRLHPLLYWGVIVGTTTAGTTMADFCDRSLGIGYTGGSLLLAFLVVSVLAAWKLVSGSIAAGEITSPGQEAFYWAAILSSNTLGTALGDWVADSGLGYERGAVLFGVLLAVIALCFYATKVSRVLLFWAAFVLTRPLGATLGDLLTKPHAHGGFAFGRFSASGLLGALMIGCIVLYPRPTPRPRLG